MQYFTKNSKFNLVKNNIVRKKWIGLLYARLQKPLMIIVKFMFRFKCIIVPVLNSDIYIILLYRCNQEAFALCNLFFIFVNNIRIFRMLIFSQTCVNSTSLSLLFLLLYKLLLLKFPQCLLPIFNDFGILDLRTTEPFHSNCRTYFRTYESSEL